MNLKRKQTDAGRASFPLLQRWGAVGSIPNQGQRKDYCSHSQVLNSWSWRYLSLTWKGMGSLYPLGWLCTAGKLVNFVYETKFIKQHAVYSTKHLSPILSALIHFVGMILLAKYLLKSLLSTMIHPLLSVEAINKILLI